MALILANDGIAASAKATLEGMGHVVDTKKYEGDELIARLKEVDCIIVRSATKMRDPQIDAGAAGHLKLIIRAGVGIDNINVDHAKEKGIAVRNTPAASVVAVAELAIGQMFNMARHISVADRANHEGRWLKKQLTGSEINGKTLGIIGFGRNGQGIAVRAKALGMKIIYYDAYAKVDGYDAVSMDELLAQSDYISVNTPALDKPVIGKAELEKCKNGVFLLNLARGNIIDEEALMDAIDAGKVAGAAIDVFTVEPIANKRLMESDKVVMTPHIGAATAEAQDRIGDMTVDLIKEFF